MTTCKEVVYNRNINKNMNTNDNRANASTDDGFSLAD